MFWVCLMCTFFYICALLYWQIRLDWILNQIAMLGTSFHIIQWKSEMFRCNASKCLCISMLKGGERNILKFWTQNEPKCQNHPGEWMLRQLKNYKFVNCINVLHFLKLVMEMFTKWLFLVFYGLQKHLRKSVFPGTSHYTSSACMNVRTWPRK